MCCGSGDLCEELGKKFKGASFTGVDYSKEMLKIAGKRLAGLSNVKLREGDCTRLPFADDSFHGAVIGYGLRNLADIEQGLAEFHRVLRSEAFFYCIDLGKPSNPLFKAVHRVHFHHIAPLLGKLLFHRNECNSFRYLPESSRFFPSPPELKTLFENAGFRQVRIQNLFCGSIACVKAVK